MSGGRNEHDDSSSHPPTSADRSSEPTPATHGVLYPNVYVWYLFLATLDVLLTFLILSDFFADADVYAPPRGREVNPLADWILRTLGPVGLIAFKFMLVLLVVGICEIVGRRKQQTGRRLAEWAVALSAVPVVVTLVQMAVDVYSWVFS